jgi:acyl carrier protein
MQSPEIYEKLTLIFRDLFDVPELVLTPQLTAEDVDGWDSLNHIRLILSIQRTFGLKFSALETGQLKNVGALVQLIEAKL